MSHRKLLRAFPVNEALTLIDVGAAGGVHERWKPFSPLVSVVGFDPREAAPTGDLGRGRTRIYPVALGDRAGETTLYLTRREIMSSVLPPNRALLAAYQKKLEHTELMEERKIPIDTLDAIATRDGFAPHVLKIDAQGSEGLVLSGAREVLARSVLVAEIEISFMERYVGQSMFDDVLARLKAAGFRLIDLTRIKRYRATNSLQVQNVGTGHGQRAGTISSADAIFLKDESTLLARAEHDAGLTLLRTIVALIAYGKPDLAARHYDCGRTSLPKHASDAAAAALRRFVSHPYGWRRIHVVADRLARRI
jgi:FkbM family methyltransferase